MRMFVLMKFEKVNILNYNILSNCNVDVRFVPKICFYEIVVYPLCYI